MRPAWRQKMSHTSQYLQSRRIAAETIQQEMSSEMRVYIKENAPLGIPDGTFFAISGATMACVASGMSLAEIKAWCLQYRVGIIGIIYFDPRKVN